VTGSATGDAATLSPDEEALLRESLRAVLTDSPSTAAVRAALRDFGWDEVVEESPDAVALLFEEQGRAGVTTTLLDGVVLAAAGLGGLDAAVLYPLPGTGTLFEPVACTLGKQLKVAGLINADAQGPVPDTIVAPVMAPDGTTALVTIDAEILSPMSARGLDSSSGWLRVLATVGPEADVVELDTTGWIHAVAAARRALSAELIGVARASLEVAVDTVSSRHQFGRPVGSFQAVRFRLAEAKVAIESAHELLRLAMRDGDPLSAATAKALAGAAADTTVRHGMQVCGAMGLTWEFPLHNAFRRASVLDGLLGDTDGLTVALGHHIASTPILPQLEPFGH
jgi:hypothetical protein